MIPRAIHRIWLGGPEPEWTRPFADTWRWPGWGLWTWDDARVESELLPLRNQDVYDNAEEIAPGHAGQLRADILRYEILQRYGGIYVDTDAECLRPFPALLDGVTAFVAWELQPRWLNNAVMGGDPDHQFFTRLVAGVRDNIRRKAGHRPNQLTGPGYITRIYRERPGGITVFDQRKFYPYGYAEIEAHGPGERWPGALMVHHWANRRRQKGAVPAVPEVQS